MNPFQGPRKTTAILADEVNSCSPGVSPSERGRLEAIVENAKVSKDLRVEKLAYIREMLVELRKLSSSIDQPMVAYLIEMALIEADTAINVGRFTNDRHE